MVYVVCCHPGHYSTLLMRSWGLISKALLLREPFGQSESLQWGALRRDAGAEKEKLFIHTPRDSVVQANVRCSAAPGLVSENLLP